MNVLVMQIPYNRYPLQWQDMRMIFQTLPFYIKRDTYERVESVVWAIYDLLEDLVTL